MLAMSLARSRKRLRGLSSGWERNCWNREACENIEGEDHDDMRDGELDELLLFI
jgi:hypothetical protein